VTLWKIGNSNAQLLFFSRLSGVSRARWLEVPDRSGKDRSGKDRTDQERTDQERTGGGGGGGGAERCRGSIGQDRTGGLCLLDRGAFNRNMLR
jgi:hypothetical protein